MHVMMALLLPRCPPCRQSIPHLSDIQRNYKHKDVYVLGITTEKDISASCRACSAMARPTEEYLPRPFHGEQHELTCCLLLLLLQKLQRFVQSSNMEYTVAADTTGAAEGQLYLKSDAKGIPHAFVVDVDNKVTFSPCIGALNPGCPLASGLWVLPLLDRLHFMSTYCTMHPARLNSV